jgi:hypothetical protein
MIMCLEVLCSALEEYRLATGTFLPAAKRELVATSLGAAVARGADLLKRCIEGIERSEYYQK